MIAHICFQNGNQSKPNIRCKRGFRDHLINATLAIIFSNINKTNGSVLNITLEFESLKVLGNFGELKTKKKLVLL